METMDNIYVLNYLINRQLGKGKKATAMFVDLKTTFDMMAVNRSVLGRSMREKGIRKGLVIRVEEALRETRNKVRIREDTGENF